MYPIGLKLGESTELHFGRHIFAASLFYRRLSQDPGHIESHTFATSTLTQFCILFKRTLITICRDQVGDIRQQKNRGLIVARRVFLSGESCMKMKSL